MTDSESHLKPASALPPSRLAAWRQLAETQPAEAVLKTLFREYAAEREQIEAEFKRLGDELEPRAAGQPAAAAEPPPAELMARRPAEPARRSVEAALPASDDEFLEAFQNSPDSIVLTRLSDGTYLAVNEGFERQSGYAAAEVIGRSTLTINTWADPDDRRRLQAELVEQGALDNVETFGRLRDGTVIPVLLAARLINFNGEQCVLAFTRDLRPLKQAEELLQHQNRELQAMNAKNAAMTAQLDRERRLLRIVIDALPDQIFAHDRDGRFVLNNRRDAEVLGVAAPEQLLGKTDADFYPPELADRFRADDQLVIGQGQPLIEHEEPSVSRDGSPRWVLTTKVPWRDSLGQVIGLVGIARDITARKRAELLIQSQTAQLEAQNQALQAQNEALERAESELRRLNAELERRVAERTQQLSLANAALVRAARMKDEFLASMSHELRTPLTGILGLAELLEMGIYGRLADTQAAQVQSIRQSGEHLLELINDILDVSKIEAGKVELQLTPVKVADVCETSLQFVQPLAEKKQLRLSLSHDLAVDVIRADGRRLKQMLVNLLSNAVKFTPPGGAVSLEVIGDAAKQQVRLAVADTGIGIAPEDLPRLFQPFVQLDNRLARQHPGTGLGLSLVMGLAELHGGSVQAESDGVPGQGSRFTIILPWPKDVQAGAPKADAAQP